MDDKQAQILLFPIKYLHVNNGEVRCRSASGYCRCMGSS